MYYSSWGHIVHFSKSILLYGNSISYNYTSWNIERAWWAHSLLLFTPFQSYNWASLQTAYHGGHDSKGWCQCDAVCSLYDTCCQHGTPTVAYKVLIHTRKHKHTQIQTHIHTRTHTCTHGCTHRRTIHTLQKHRQKTTELLSRTHNTQTICTYKQNSPNYQNTHMHVHRQWPYKAVEVKMKE